MKKLTIDLTKRENFIKMPLATFFLILSVFFVSCDKDEDVPTPKAYGKAEAIDIAFFDQIKKVGDEFDKGEIWKGYNFSKMPMYIAYRDKDKKLVRGYLINPHKELEGALEVESKVAKGLTNVYRYDKEMSRLNDVLTKGNGIFDFMFIIDNVKYYAQVYDNQEVNRGDGIVLALHEMFHVYQINSGWKEPEGSIQDQDSYPINKDLVALQIMASKIGELFPGETDKAVIKDYLKMYVAIRSKEMEIDPSPRKMVKNMANSQENHEGSAKYIEFLCARNILPEYKKQNPTLSLGIQNYLTTKDDVKGHFAFGVWYDTGAAAIHMLKTLGTDIEAELPKEHTPFDIASKLLNMTDAEKAEALQKAKDKFDWTAIQEKATELVQLK